MALRLHLSMGMIKGSAIVLIVGVSALVSNAFALDIYPAKGQSPSQQARDTAECQDYAKRQTGFDPQQALSNPPPAAPQQPMAVRPRKRAKEEKKELQAQKGQQAQTEQKMAQYNKAESVCLRGKGYSVG